MTMAGKTGKMFFLISYFFLRCLLIHMHTQACCHHQQRPQVKCTIFLGLLFLFHKILFFYSTNVEEDGKGTPDSPPLMTMAGKFLFIFNILFFLRCLLLSFLFFYSTNVE